jgi:hypothetical protein
VESVAGASGGTPMARVPPSSQLGEREEESVRERMREGRKTS